MTKPRRDDGAFFSYTSVVSLPVLYLQALAMS
jgi:hypothetical protein